LRKFFLYQSKDTRSKPSINRPDYYYINIDGAIVGGINGTNSSSFPPFVGFVDTATTLTMLPSGKSQDFNPIPLIPNLPAPIAIATSIARSFNPPATIASSTQLYEVPCNATAPKLAITVGGVNFPVSADDLIVRPLLDPATNQCIVGFQDGGGDYILGATFLNNVLSTFDLGTLEVRFTALSQKL
jgi:hypothetical protein